jgi:hypothetical protein
VCGRRTRRRFIESFNSIVRRKCLSQHWFTSLEDAQQTLDVFREDYNHTRPHGSLAEFRWQRVVPKAPSVRDPRRSKLAALVAQELGADPNPEGGSHEVGQIWGALQYSRRSLTTLPGLTVAGLAADPIGAIVITSGIQLLPLATEHVAVDI